jgi:thiol-disulfide isomerase/thioredoxin
MVTQGSYNNDLQLFDELSLKMFPPLSKRLLLKNCMLGINEHFSAADINKYLDKYVAATNDSILYKETIEKYNLSADADQLLLQDIQGNAFSLQQLLTKYKGKVLYIDFWASWCAPCRAEMPPASKLRKQLADKDVVFVYMAWNDSEEAWAKAAKNEGLAELPTSYFIRNSKNSKFLRQIELELIPRYIILDKEGKLVEMNAPRPSSEAIVGTLAKYW